MCRSPRLYLCPGWTPAEMCSTQRSCAGLLDIETVEVVPVQVNTQTRQKVQ